VRTSGGIAAALCVCGVLSAKSAAANGRYPASTQVVFSGDPADPGLVVVRATYGLLVSGDGGATWRWVCEGALGVPSVSVEDPSIAVTAGDALVVGLFEGLEVSRAASGGVAPVPGCSFGCVAGPLAGQSIVDLATVASAPHSVLAMSSTYVFDDAGHASLDTRVWESADDGAGFAQRGPAFDPGVEVTTLDVAARDPQRLYVTGTRGFGAARTASLFVSADGGGTWTERPLPFDSETEVSVYIGAIDPADADRVYLRSSGASRLLVTSDAGRSFRVPLALTGQMLGFALSADGAKVYAGSVEDGLLVATGDADGGLAFHKTSSIHVQCLATRGAELWACSDEASGFYVGASIDDGASFASRLPLGVLPGPFRCPPDAEGPASCGAAGGESTCSGDAFDTVCASIAGCASDAGAGKEGGAPGLGASGLTADASAEAIRTRVPSCGCSMLPASGSREVGAACVIAAAALRRRRRRGD
jgi:hypothetical protein